MSHYSLAQLKLALSQSWSPESIYPKLKWHTANPTRGQCAVSALVIQDYLGGEIKRYKVVVDEVEEKHFVNMLPSGEIVDVTRSQYADDIKMVHSEPNLGEYKSVREKLLHDDNNRHRYHVLGSRVAKQLAIDEMRAR